ncbi:glycosyl hydrolases family 38 N-terminal domain-domain-containing protein [Kockovaella imperatae]|uniref:alpha-mannosidase n=1 Tax=Kockovaella imperatae TaxID=4999 RepID=A0A1Y1UFJ4_9TREE|nr:glycosyl hydrolases family 38 N-terminal domain-domain-containing protein [Kockovaella imperatae]ORX36276.1 glycosyl hydrolases family 38 N-terminal domain-domain-containing protein [Kockovaella imperatae]
MCRTAPTYPQLTDRVNYPLIPNIALQRLDTFLSGPYATQGLLDQRDIARIDDEKHVKMTGWTPENPLSKPTFKEAKAALNGNHTKDIRKGHLFGPSWSNHWLKVELMLPESFQNVSKSQEVLWEFDPSSEALIFDEEGNAIHAITGIGKTVGPDEDPTDFGGSRTDHVISPSSVVGGKYSVYVEVSCNGLFGAATPGTEMAPPDPNRTFLLRTADIVLPNQPVRALALDFAILRQIAKSNRNPLSSLSARALKACNDIMDTYRQPEGHAEAFRQVVHTCRLIAADILGDIDKRALVAGPGSDRTHVWAIGHCHIDTAWLWTYSQTQQKVARSWSTQCDLMDRYDNYHFAASSAQQYLWLETLYPSTFANVKRHVQSGKFHPVGGAWLEHDCMLPSGESLVRQYLYGQRYFKSRFGEYCREAWLPDTFGYASQLPQILRLAGLNYFFTQKLSWNNITNFPYTSFNWVGIDGSQVLAHMTPVDTYNGQCNYPEIEKAMYNNKNLSVLDECLYLFGNGDGGGGPTPDHLDKLERLTSLAQTNPEVPGIALTKPADFFDHICQETHSGQDLPSWRGELYLEFHRGTYTTQANVKKGNRTMERLLRDLEYFATLASLADPEYKYPKAALDEMWQDTLLNQFHDVLPGSTISLVVDDALAIYERRQDQAHVEISKALSVLYPKSDEDSLVVADAVPQLARSEVMRASEGRHILVETDSYGVLQEISASDIGAPRAYKDGQMYKLENGDFSLTISHGRITSLVDLRLEKELIHPGPGASTGGLMLYEDYPLKFDAWDVEVYHLNSFEALEFEDIYARQDSLRASLKAVVTFGDSQATLTFSVDAVSRSHKQDSDRRSSIRIEADIDWHETHKVLKFALPIDVHSPHAIFGTQFGLVERPTHRNTLADQAKFEVCGHLLADLSEPGYGVSLVAAHKYGYAVEGNTMRLTLLRSPTSPDAHADRGHHTFDFAIMPHVSSLQQGETYRQALGFVNPPYLLTGVRQREGPHVRFQIDGQESKSIVLDTVKRSEDGDGVVLRLFESLGCRAKGVLSISGIRARRAKWVNILEEPIEDVLSNLSRDRDVKISLDFRCFEIKTLLLTL